MPQVSLAVLLDNFVTASARLEAQEALKLSMEKKALRQFKNPLEPLVARHVRSTIQKKRGDGFNVSGKGIGGDEGRLKANSNK